MADDRERVTLAWLLVVAVSVLVALLFDYEQIRQGAVILYYTFIVDLAKTYPESKVHGKDAEMLVAFSVIIAILFVHTILLNEIEIIAVDLGAAQVVALAALASRGYVIIQAEGSLVTVLEDADPVTHPFITVGSAVTFLFGLIGLAGRSIFGWFGISTPSSGSSILFGLLLVIGATAGLGAYLFEAPSSEPDDVAIAES